MDVSKDIGYYTGDLMFQRMGDAYSEDSGAYLFSEVCRGSMFRSILRYPLDKRGNCSILYFVPQ